MDTEPTLDDVSRIPDIKTWALCFLEEFDFTSITQALFAASFFFELSRKPVRRKKGYQCYGSIRCRSPNIRAFVIRVLQEYPLASFATEDTDLGNVSDRSLCTMCGRYRKNVSFLVYHPDQELSIYLTFNKLRRCKISGFPQRISNLVKKQGLELEFGSYGYQTHPHEDLGRCSCRKRKGDTMVAVPANKRRRLTRATN